MPEVEVIIEKPVKFKTYFALCSDETVEEERDFMECHFDTAGIPYDDEGMDFENAFYLINCWNAKYDVKYWLRI